MMAHMPIMNTANIAIPAQDLRRRFDDFFGFRTTGCFTGADAVGVGVSSTTVDVV